MLLRLTLINLAKILSSFIKQDGMYLLIAYKYFIFAESLLLVLDSAV